MGNSICDYLSNIDVIPVVIDSSIRENCRYQSFQCNLSDADETESVLNSIFEEHRHVNHLINAVRIRSEIHDNKNIKSTSICIMEEMNAYLNPMHFFCSKTHTSSSLVNISSILGKSISSDVPIAYHVAKAAIEQASRYYATKYNDTKVRINCISPGLISNGGSEDCSYESDAGSYARLACRLPIQRSGGHNAVAALATFLLSELSDFVVGENIKVDGGGDLLEPLSISN